MTSQPNNLPSTSTSLPNPVPPFDRALADSIAAARNDAEQRGQQLVLCRAIPASTAVAMRRRMLALGAAIGREHAVEARHLSAIAAMLDCWPSLAKADKLALARKFVGETSDQPSWAVEKACMAIRLGQAPGVSFDFPPSTIRLREEVRRHTAPLLQEALEIRNLLEAEVEYVPTAEERARVALGFQKLNETLKQRRQDEADAAAPKRTWAAPSDDDLRRLYPKREAAQ
jgi:hypothetical protein